MENKKLITAEDLMVGDLMLVGYTESNIDGDYDVFYNQEKLTLAHFKFWADNDWNENDFAEFLRPIPLTKEILVNNGFERIDTTIGNYALRIYVENVYDKNDYSTREFLRIGTYLQGGYFDGIFEIENKTQDEYTSCKRRCKYVHELQHALKLCEIDKEIIL